MNCEKCGKKFLQWKKYIFHVEYVHRLTNYYPCPFTNCSRLFHRKDVLKKHIQKQHSNTAEVLVESKVLSSSTSESVGDGNICNNQPKADNLHDTNANSSFDIINSVKEKTVQFKALFEKSITKIVSEFYDNLSLTRSTIQTIIESVSNFLSSGLFDIIKQSLADVIKYQRNKPESDFETAINDILMMIHILENPFISVNSDYKRFQYFKKSKCFIIPLEQKLGVTADRKRKNGNVSLQLLNRHSYFIPMRTTLQSFLQLPGVFNTITAYQENISNNIDPNNRIMRNIVNGSVWNNISYNKTTLPLILYFDDFESGNPLGSHAGCYKIGAVYFTVSSIPPIFSQRLQNIFLAMLFYSADRIEFGNNITFDPIIKELQFLENEGLIIETPSGNHTVYFILQLVVGDNLGLHSIFGLTESFASKNFCRFCTTEKLQTHIQTTESENCLRLTADYNDHLFSKLGVKENCVWHQLRKFHIYENLTCDVMHDLFEGVHRYDMALIISDFIKKKYFSLELLNKKIKYFSYSSEEKNIPPSVNQEHLKNGSIIFSASEMLNFVLNFKFIVGELVSENDEVWNFYLKLMEITEILISPTMSLATVENLKCLIEEHHKLYINLFEENLKPKHHILLHYHRIILKNGPPILYSSMRFEAKHRDFKISCHNVRSRKNLPYTLALRSQLKMCYRLLSRKGLEDVISFGSIYHTESIDNLESFQILNKSSSLCIEEYYCTRWYELNGSRYESTTTILMHCGENCDNTDIIPNFCQVLHILISKSDSKLSYFMCQLFEVVCYNSHFQAYKISPLGQYQIVSITDLYSNVPLNGHYLGDGGFYVSASKC